VRGDSFSGVFSSPPKKTPKPPKNQVRNEKKPGWFGYIRDYTTQLNRVYNKPL